MTIQPIIDMLDDLNSTRVKLRLAAARRRLWSIVAQRQEDSVDVHSPANPPSLPDDDDVPSGGYQ